MTGIESQQTPRVTTESVVLDRLAERLATQFPELPAEVIVHTIRGEYDGFAASKIREFVPVLVERSVRADLEHLTPGHRA